MVLSNMTLAKAGEHLNHSFFLPAVHSLRILCASVSAARLRALTNYRTTRSLGRVKTFGNPQAILCVYSHAYLDPLWEAGVSDDVHGDPLCYSRTAIIGY